MDDARRSVPVRQTFLRYSVAVAAVAVAAGLRLALGEWFGVRVPYLLFFPAVAAVAAYGGLRPGLLATALSLVVAVGLFLEIPGDTPGRIATAVTAGLFAVTGAMVSGLAESLHAARRRIEDQRDALARQTAAVEDLNDRLQSAAWVAGTVAWDWDLTAGTLLRSPSAADVFGLDPAASADEFLTQVHPDDREPLRAAWDRAAGGEELDVQFRMAHPDGHLLWLADRGRLRKHPGTGRPHLSGVCVDVTARKQAEERLRASEERFRSLVAASAPVLYRMSPDWSVMLELTGSRTVPETAGPRADWLTAYVSPVDHGRVRTAVERSLATGEPFEVEHRVPRADGTEGWAFSRAVPVRDAAGQLVEWFGAVTDTTARKRAEGAVQASEERFRRLADAVPQIVYVVAADGQIEFVNRRWADYTGQPGAGAADLPAVVHLDDLPELNRRWAAAQATGGVLEAEFRIRRAADGADRWFLTRSVPEVGADGRPVRWYGTSTDIDDQKALENDLRRSEERHRALLDSLTDGFVVLGPDWRFEYVNPAFERMNGVRRQDVLGRDHWELYPATVGTRLEAEYRRVVATGGTAEFENYYPPWDRWFAVKAYPGPDGGLCVQVRETTAAKRAELAVRAGEERYRTLFESMDQGFFVVEVLFDADRPVDYRILEANPAYQAHSGLTDPVGRTAREMVPDLDPHWFEVYGRVAVTGEPVRFAREAPALGRWFDVSAFRVGDPAAHKVAILFTDITARKRAETERERLLREVQAERGQLADIFQYAPSMLAVMAGPAHVFDRVNDRYQRAMGRELLGRPAREAFPEVEGQGFFELLDRVYRTGEPFAGDNLLVNLRPADGRPPEEQFIDMVFQPVRGPDGAVTGILFHGIDRTEQARAAAAVRASERAAAERAAELEAVLRAAPAAIWIAHDPGCTVVTGNPASYRLLGATEGTNVSPTPAGPPPAARGFREFDGDRPIPPAELPLQRAATGNADVPDTELALVFDDKRVRHIYGNAAPLRDADGRVRGAVAAFTDVTALKELERRLREADRRKDEFLATLAHELRNPLAPVRNGLQILRMTTDPPTLERVREMMTRQVGHMVRLIDDLLDVSRITRGKVALDRRRIELAEVVKTAVETSQPQVDAGGHTLTVDLPTDPLPVDADPVRLAQVLGNLLTNAAKYSERGGRIRLTAGRDDGQVVVTVADTGIGIPADSLPRVFELFAQVESAAGHRQGGLGIGLSLVRGLVQLHGGSVTAASDGVGRGSTFTVRLPAAD